MENEHFYPTDEDREDANPSYGSREARESYRSNLRNSIPLSQRAEWKDLKERVNKSKAESDEALMKTKKFLKTLTPEEKESWYRMNRQQREEFQRKKSAN